MINANGICQNYMKCQDTHTNIQAVSYDFARGHLQPEVFPAFAVLHDGKYLCLNNRTRLALLEAQNLLEYCLRPSCYGERGGRTLLQARWLVALRSTSRPTVFCVLCPVFCVLL